MPWCSLKRTSRSAPRSSPERSAASASIAVAADTKLVDRGPPARKPARWPKEFGPRNAYHFQLSRGRAADVEIADAKLPRTGIAPGRSSKLQGQRRVGRARHPRSWDANLLRNPYRGLLVRARSFQGSTLCSSVHFCEYLDPCCSRPLRAERCRVVRFRIGTVDVKRTRFQHAAPPGDWRCAQQAPQPGWEPVFIGQYATGARATSLGNGDGVAEIEFENGATGYLGDNSALQFTVLSAADTGLVTRLTLVQGSARFYANVDGGVLKCSGGVTRDVAR